MVAELISVGTELLLGDIVNTNAAFLARQCAALGLSVYHQSVVGDNEERLAEVLSEAMERSDVVILSGGLGPTEDDLTRETCARVMDMPLEEDEHTRRRIREYFSGTSQKEIPESNWRQAMVPRGASVLDNDNGTAPGLILEKNHKMLVLLPGPPAELIPMFQKKAVPYLRRLQPEVILSQTVKLCGIGESKAESRIQDLIDAQTNPTIATYAGTGEVHLRLTAKARGAEQAEKMFKPLIKEIRKRFGTAVYSLKEEETMEMVVVRLLKKYELTVTTAESCTGGMLAARIVNVPGSSEVFSQGLVTYSNKSKRRLLDVNKATLKKYTAVSKETAREMAMGGVLASDADICVAVTGIAGPDGGTEEKPVGLVYIACCIRESVVVEKHQFRGNRSRIRELAVINGLDLLRRCILDHYAGGGHHS